MKNDDIIPYHGNRIKQILRQEYNCRLEKSGRDTRQTEDQAMWNYII